MSDLTDAIARARRQIARDEAPIRRQLRAVYRDALDRLTADLDAVTRMIADARAAGIDVSPDWLRRQTRYRQLIADAETQYARFTRDGLRILREGQVAAVSGGAHSALEMADAAGVTFAGRVNVPAVERLVSAMQPGSPLRDVLDAYGVQAAKVIEDELTAGLIDGTGTREIVRNVRRGITSGTNKARLDALVRTESMRAFRGALFDGYAQLGVDRWVWTAHLGPRTCLACLSLSGTVHPMSEQFMRAHVNCRCVPTPWTTYVDVETGESWFARQSAATQAAMMPSGEAFEAFRRGDVTLRDFRGYRRSQVWGTAYVQRSGREAIARARRVA